MAVPVQLGILPILRLELWLPPRYAVRNIWRVNSCTEWLHWSVTVQLYTQVPASWAGRVCVVGGPLGKNVV